MLNAYIRARIRPLPMTDMEIGSLRRILERRPIEALPKGITANPISLKHDEGGVAGEWVTPDCGKANGDAPDRPAPDRLILYFHGGGYAFGTPRAYRAVTTRLARASSLPVFAPRYRRAPEYTCPAPIDDARAVWHWLTAPPPAGLGIDPCAIIVGGDSAGGGLSLALAQSLAGDGMALPGGIFLWSPWTDLTGASPSISDNAERDVIFQEYHLRRAGPRYAGDLALDDPRVSPLYGSFAGLAPLFITLSNDEMLRDDSLRLAEKAEKAGLDVLCVRRDGLVHAWPIFPPFLPEADETIRQTADFALRCLAAAHAH